MEKQYRCLHPLLVEKWWWKTLCPGWDTHTHDLMRQKARLCGNPRTWKPENPSQDGDGHSQTHVWVINGPTWATLPYADGLFCSVSAERASRCSPVWEDHGPDMQCNPGGQQSHSNGDPKVWYIYIYIFVSHFHIGLGIQTYK